MIATNPDLPMIGQTRRTLFWVVLLIALLALTALMGLTSRGAIALAATIPVPFTVTNSTLKGTHLRLFPGVSQADKGTPVAVNQLDATMVNMVVTKNFSMLGRTVTLKLSAGTGDTPVTANGLTLDATSLKMDNAQFNNLSLDTGGAGGLEMDSSSLTFTNPIITSPYLLANSITLPGLSLAINFG